jgi:dTDP-L-rhamnose 4-epimerase
MVKKILITGGAGFIGSHLADELLDKGYEVRVLDNLCEQVHGSSRQRPSYLAPEVELIVGDIRDKRAVKQALDGIDVVYHFAAMVGVGQSMYALDDYTDVNNRGTAILWEVLAECPVQKVIVASSMSIYGEGFYKRASGEIIEGNARPFKQLKAGAWELSDPNGGELIPIPTSEDKTPCLSSIYALSKYDQEQMCLIMGKALNIPTTALRFFNVYGTRQALSNPYTGVLAIFASRYLNDNPPLIFEDGYQKRDFVSVKDVAIACRLAMETPEASQKVFNIGSGQCYTVLEIAQRMAAVLEKEDLSPEITMKYRIGDIRHCFGDIRLARKILGYNPEVSLEDGLEELAAWLQGQQAEDRVNKAKEELASRGLTLEVNI